MSYVIPSCVRAAALVGLFWAIFEAPADATGLKFQARSISAVPDKKLVDLGALPMPAAPAALPPSAAAHPSGTPKHHRSERGSAPVTPRSRRGG